jgi:hypothetical protein
MVIKMTGNTTKVAGIALALILLGAVFMAGLGFLGILISLSKMGAETGSDGEGKENTFSYVNEPELEEAKSDAQSKYEESVLEAKVAGENAPDERGFAVDGAYTPAPMPDLDLGTGSESSRTRGSDPHSQEGYLGEKDAPAVPDVDLKDTTALLGPNQEVLGSLSDDIASKQAPDGIGTISYPTDTDLPADETGGSLDTDELDGANDQVSSVEETLKKKLGNFAPDMDQAGLDDTTLTALHAQTSVKSTWDSDLDGNAEKTQVVNMTFGQRNNTDGTILQYIAGYELKMEDRNDDGTPDYKEETVVIYAKLSLNNRTLAEGVSYTHVLKNDTDGDNIVDDVLAQHLAYGWIVDPSGDVLAAAQAFEYKAVDADNDGTFDREEGTGIVFFRHTSVQTLIPVREAVVIVHALKEGSDIEYGQIAFQRCNDTQGNKLLEEGYVLYYTEKNGLKNLIGIAGRNDTENGVVQYALLNATDDGSELHVSALAVRNTTENNRTLTEAVYLQWNDTGSHQEGVLAAASNDTVVEAFALISFRRDLSGTAVTFENVTAIVGHVDRTTGKNSTFLFAQKITVDADADGNPESIKEALGIGRSIDANSDGKAESEGYFLAMRERTDNDSDGNVEIDHQVLIMGFKTDANSDGTIESEKGLVVNRTFYDNNTNGNVELSNEALIAFEKTYGTSDHEKYVIAWKNREDVNDDGTQINEKSGLYTVEK